MAPSNSFSAHRLLELLSNCPTSWHATRYITQQLKDAGFERLQDSSKWNLHAGKGYWIEVGPGALIAFIAQSKAKNLALMGCHTESPMLQLKNKGLTQEDGHWIGHLEPYGGPILASWFFKDLGLAGRILVAEANGVSEHLVHLDEPVGILLSPAIHLDRDMNQRGFAPDKQRHLKVLLGSSGDKHPLEIFLDRWAKEHGQSSSKAILGHELFFYPLEPVRHLSCDESWLASWRVDNLASCAACLDALLTSKPNEEIFSLAVFANHEEIGSQTWSGASSNRYIQVIYRIFDELGLTPAERASLISRGLLCSVDGAHGLHPGYSELYEPSHKPKLGQGPVIKHHPCGRYATDARSCAKIQWHAQQCKVPLQSFHIRADLPCGSTIGPILSTALGIEGVDIGLAQLAMHATREVMHLDDYFMLVRLLNNFLETTCSLREGH